MRTDEGQGTIDCSLVLFKQHNEAGGGGCANQSLNQKISHLNNSPLLVERD